MKQEGLLSRYKQQRLLAVLPSGMDKKSAGCGSQLVGPPDPESPAAAPSRESVKGRIPPKDLPPQARAPKALGLWSLLQCTQEPPSDLPAGATPCPGPHRACSHPAMSSVSGSLTVLLDNLQGLSEAISREEAICQEDILNPTCCPSDPCCREGQ